VIDVFTKVDNAFPVYSIHGNYIDSPDYESKGNLKLDLYGKTIEGILDFNSGESLTLNL
jgi:hypothetical protein